MLQSCPSCRYAPDCLLKSHLYRLQSMHKLCKMVASSRICSVAHLTSSLPCLLYTYTYTHTHTRTHGRRASDAFHVKWSAAAFHIKLNKNREWPWRPGDRAGQRKQIPSAGLISVPLRSVSTHLFPRFLSAFIQTREIYLRSTFVEPGQFYIFLSRDDDTQLPRVRKEQPEESARHGATKDHSFVWNIYSIKLFDYIESVTQRKIYIRLNGRSGCKINNSTFDIVGRREIIALRLIRW